MNTKSLIPRIQQLVRRNEKLKQHLQEQKNVNDRLRTRIAHLLEEKKVLKEQYDDVIDRSKFFSVEVATINHLQEQCAIRQDIIEDYQNYFRNRSIII